MKHRSLASLPEITCRMGRDYNVTVLACIIVKRISSQGLLQRCEGQSTNMTASYVYNCTWQNSGMIAKSFAGYPCGPLNETVPVVSCCGLADVCLSHNICTYAHSLPNGSGYYAAGCSDGNFSSATSVSGVCTSRCGKSLRLWDE